MGKKEEDIGGVDGKAEGDRGRERERDRETAADGRRERGYTRTY